MFYVAVKNLTMNMLIRRVQSKLVIKYSIFGGERVKYQVSLESVSAEEETFIDKTMQHIKSALLWKNEQDNSDPRNVSFRDRVWKYCLLFKRPSVF
ncbi:unnamed protein product [Euphydryas editha]|uniref:Uncharacterized protein n=1 Tax=Euphydryas editha TaxID=104508 RepID=A0AAU9TBB6_EUPED|nr:unnamed protein product [Euphydryas editha]